MAEKDQKKKDEGEEGEKTAEPAPAGGKKKLIIAAGSGVAALIVIILIIVLVMSGGKKTSKTVEEEVESLPTEKDAHVAAVDTGADELDEGEEPIGAIFPLESFVVNLKGGRFLRMQMQVEFVERDISQRFFVRQVIVRDGIISLLGTFTADDLMTSEGKDKLRSQLKELVNEALKKQDVKRVYFTQFVVQ